MANIHEDNESCKERMKEFIRKGFDRTEVIREVKKEFLNVNNDTFYRWYKSVILEQDIKEWEKENEKQHKDQLQDFTDLKRLIYLRNKKKYIDDNDPDEVAKAEKTLLTHYLDKIKLTGIN